MANQLVTKIAEKVWVETQMGRLEDWLPFAEYAVNEVIAAQQGVEPTVENGRTLPTVVNQSDSDLPA